MPLKDLPTDAQPREKLLARGPTALADAELLAILLRTGIVGKGVLQMAQELLDPPGIDPHTGAVTGGFGGIAGLLAFIGVSLLLHRRLTDARIRATSKTSDILLLWLLWVQLALGLATLPLSAQHLDGSVMMQLAGWAQAIVTFQSNAVGLLAGVSWVFKLHMALGMTVFLIFPFTRLVHVWSGFGTLAYIARPYQLVRARRMNVPAGQNQPR